MKQHSSTAELCITKFECIQCEEPNVQLMCYSVNSFETYRIVLQNLDLIEDSDVNADPECVCDDERDEEILVYKNTRRYENKDDYQIIRGIIQLLDSNKAYLEHQNKKLNTGCPLTICNWIWRKRERRRN